MSHGPEGLVDRTVRDAGDWEVQWWASTRGRMCERLVDGAIRYGTMRLWWIGGKRVRRLQRISGHRVTRLQQIGGQPNLNVNGV